MRTRHSNSAEAGQYGEKGLQCLQTATKPDGTSDADFQKLKAETADFQRRAGNSALRRTKPRKDYAKAQQYLRAAVETDPATC